MQQNNHYTFDSKVRFSEVDHTGRITLPGIINYFQDCSTFQSESIGLGVDYFAEHNRAWVLTYWQVVIEEYPRLAQEINIATQREISIGDLAKEIIAQINPDAKIVCDEQRLRPEKSEVNRLLGANAKIKELTDWKQQYTFEQGIAETIAWIRQNMAAYKTDIYNV